MRFVNSSDKTAVMDYSAALASAVAWLGHRHLLARPVARLTPEEKRPVNFDPGSHSCVAAEWP
jgi:hypothetical protein